MPDRSFLVPARVTPLVVLTLLLLLAAQVTHAIYGQSLTWDEGDHIFAGYTTWRTGDYGLNPEHPPLVKGLATIPLLPLHLKVPPLQGRFFKDEAYFDGRELLFRNQPAYSPRSLVFRVRLMTLLISLTAALLVFAAACEMFNVQTGLVALFLFVFEPNLLAHAAYVTTDMAAACTIFATVYAFWRYTAKPSWQRLLVTGLAAGLALAAKHSTVLLAPILLLLVLGELLPGQAQRRAKALSLCAAFAAIVLIGVAVLWAFYGFRYAARPAPLVLAPTLTQYVGPLAGLEARGILSAARFHLLPESWLYGLTDVRAMANGMPSYFFGHVYNHGIWFYFPVLFLIKSTLAELALLALTAWALLRRWLPASRQVFYLAAPPLLYLAVAMSSHLNIGARHILPIWIFTIPLAAGGATALARRSRPWLIAVALLLLAHSVTTVAASPNYIAYANEAWGGPSQTYRYLSDSNTDWAQQLVATASYVHQHHLGDPSHPCYIAYFAAPFLLPEDYGIPCQRLPTFDSLSVRNDFLTIPPLLTGTVLLSAGDLNGFEFGSSILNPYESFRDLTPADTIQHGIFVYNGSFPVPLAAALTHTQRADALLAANDLPAALAEARLARQLAPDDLTPNLTLARILLATHQPESLPEIDDALARARLRTLPMDPATRQEWQSTLAHLQPTP